MDKQYPIRTVQQLKDMIDEISQFVNNYGNIYTDSTLSYAFGGSGFSIINLTTHKTPGMYVNPSGNVLRETGGDPSRGLYTAITRSGVVTL